MKDVALVTGAAGFIGSHLAKRLLGLGYRVIGLDSFDDYYPAEIKWDNVRNLETAADFQLQQGDIRDVSLLARIFSENSVSVVAHLAARAGVRPSLEQPLLYEDINVGGTVNLLEASRNHGIRQFIFASSSSVYGSNHRIPFSEDAYIDVPVAPYATSKAAAELYCRTYNHLYNLPVVILRFFTVYGPRQRPEMAIHRFVRMVDKGDEITLFGNDTSRDYTYIDDIISGIEAVLAYREESFQIFNLGGGRNISLGYLLKVIEETLGKKARAKHCPLPAGELSVTLANISKAQSLLGYQPKTSIEEGIRLFTRWYLENRRVNE
jgi:UDP-glucuronate 4-epimerase